MAAIINTERIPLDTRKNVTTFIEKLLDLHANNVKTVALYGSAVGRYYRPKSSDINLLCIFNDIKFQDLKKTLKLISWGIPKRKISQVTYWTFWKNLYLTLIFPMKL